MTYNKKYIICPSFAPVPGIELLSPQTFLGNENNKDVLFYELVTSGMHLRMGADDYRQTNHVVTGLELSVPPTKIQGGERG